jgi:hypothetical protein
MVTRELLRNYSYPTIQDYYDKITESGILEAFDMLAKCSKPQLVAFEEYLNNHKSPRSELRVLTQKLLK